MQKRLLPILDRSLNFYTVFKYGCKPGGIIPTQVLGFDLGL